MALFITILISIVIATAWASGIDNMMTNHPDYKGEDLFDEDKK